MHMQNINMLRLAYKHTGNVRCVCKSLRFHRSLSHRPTECKEPHESLKVGMNVAPLCCTYGEIYMKISKRQNSSVAQAQGQIWL